VGHPSVTIEFGATMTHPLPRGGTDLFSGGILYRINRN